MVNFEKNIVKILKKGKPSPKNSLWYGEPNFGSFLKNSEIDQIYRFIKKSNKWVNGFGPQSETIEFFENQFKSYCNTKYAISTCNNGVAFDLVLQALKLKPGDEVITPALNFKAWHMALIGRKIKIKFCDVNLHDLNINLNDLEKKITKKTKMICPVHYAGTSCDVDKIEKIVNIYSKKYNHKIYTVYDSARIVGGKYGNAKVGNGGDCEIFSFHSAKIISTMGEGGMITTNNHDLASKIYDMRNYGGDKNWGLNYRITSIGALMGSLQFQRIDDITKKRIEVAKKRLSYLNNQKKIILPKIKNNIFYIFPIRLGSEYKSFHRNNLITALEKKYGIICGTPKSTNQRWQFIKKNTESTYLKNTDLITNNTFFPILHPKINKKQNEYISAAIIHELKNV